MKKIDYSYIIRLKKLGFSLNAIAKQCGCKWETVQRTILRCEEAWGGIGNIPGDATSEDIAFIINSGTGGQDSSYLQPDCDEVIQRCRKGEKRDMAWADYVKDAEKAGKKAYQISRFNEIVSDYARQKDIAILVPKIPGQECQVDWVGDKAYITDYDSKEKVELHLFVMVLPYSSYFYTEAFTDCRNKKVCHEVYDGCPSEQCKREKCCYCPSFCMTALCKSYVKEGCEKLVRAPYVCNGCRSMSKCTLEKHLYKAEKAQKEYEDTLSGCRSGFAIAEEEAAELGSFLRNGLRRGQSIYHIIQSVGEEVVGYSAKTIYTYCKSQLKKA